MVVVGAVDLEEAETGGVVAEEAETGEVVVGGDDAAAFGQSRDGETNSVSAVQLGV